ncbi:MAG: hypothetical protein JNK30_02125 [Phenylobacterium sp.]|uniref:hypothetical protein n=1 Tax=Phenylobacterium sp. TaxID=1871053 RepID=UPI001A4F4CF6|nr:hypothetical protein [Phenylobacterium sp.]MBL8770153.1 hypothetical protein [Phenylobacterium sp.]
MKRQSAIILAAALIAGPAAAQGTFSPGQRPGATFGSPGSYETYKPKSYLPQQPAPSSTSPRRYGAPESPQTPGFEPYRPFSGRSVYSTPYGASRSEPCEISVYVNACGRR